MLTPTQQSLKLMVLRSNTEKSSAEKKRAPEGGRFSHIYVIMAAVISAALINFLLIINAIVPSGSMEPTIPEGQAVIGWRPAYIFSEPQRGDVIIFRHEELGNYNILKRIAAVPGDIVEVREDGVYINSSLYAACTGDDNTGNRTFTVPEKSYFVMGDNIEHSFDSRKWIEPYVAEDDIKAKVIFGYFPELYFID